MIVNLDQTPSKFMQSLRHTMTRKGIGNVEFAGLGGNRSITAAYVITLDGRLLLIQLIYDGKTNIPRVDFPSSFSGNANQKHVKFPVLLILDVFRGQMTQEVTSLLAENSHRSVCAGCRTT